MNTEKPGFTKLGHGASPLLKRSRLRIARLVLAVTAILAGANALAHHQHFWTAHNKNGVSTPKESGRTALEAAVNFCVAHADSYAAINGPDYLDHFDYIGRVEPGTFFPDDFISYTCFGTRKYDKGSDYPWVGNGARRETCPHSDLSGLYLEYCVPTIERNDGARGICPIEAGGTNPINITTGNKYQKEPVVVGSGHGLPSFSYHYNSRPEGQKWRHTYEARILGGFDGSRVMDRAADDLYPRYALKIRRADGQLLTFSNEIDYYAVAGSGSDLHTWVSEVDEKAKLTPMFQEGEITGFQLRYSDNTLDEFDRAGRLVAKAGRNGERQTVEYDANGNLYRVVGETGAALTFSQTGSQLTITDPNGEQYVVDMDANGDVQAIHFPADPAQAPGGTTIRTYRYQNPNFPRHLTSIVDGNGQVAASWSYDDHGRATSSEHAGGVDRHNVVYNADGTTSVTGPLGQVRTYSYVSPFGLNKISNVTGGACDSCGGDAATRTYDEKGFLASKTDFEGNVTRYVHDDLGREVSRTEAAGMPEQRTVLTAWHDIHRKPTLITEPGKTTAYTYNDRGQVLTRTVTDAATGDNRTTTYSYNAQKLLASIDGPRTDVADVTAYTYDASGNRSTMTNALGHVTQFTDHDGAGRLLRMIDPNGLETTFSYHPRGWLTSRTIGGATTAFEYDAVGNLTRLTLPDGSYLDYGYDAANRLTSITDGLGNRIEYTLDAAGNRTREEVKDSSGALKRLARQVYDDLNRLRQVVGAADQTTSYDYDANGNQTGTTDALNRITTSTYDALDRLTAVTDAANGVTRSSYDPADNLIAVTDPRGNATTYEYNGFGEKTRQVSPDTGVT